MALLAWFGVAARARSGRRTPAGGPAAGGFLPLRTSHCAWHRYGRNIQQLSHDVFQNFAHPTAPFAGAGPDEIFRHAFMLYIMRGCG